MLSIEDQIVLALRRIFQAIAQYSRQIWRDSGLTAPQLAALREILAGVNTTPVSLAEALHVSQPTMTGILSRLEKHGWIERRRSETDRRSIVAVPTEKGRELAQKAPPLLRDRFRQELAGLPTWQQTEMLAMLQRAATMMHAPIVVEGPFLFEDVNDQHAQPATKGKAAKRLSKSRASVAKRGKRPAS